MKILYVNPGRLNENGTPLKYKKALLPTLTLAVLDALTPSHYDVTVKNRAAMSFRNLTTGRNKLKKGLVSITNSQIFGKMINARQNPFGGGIK